MVLELTTKLNEFTTAQKKLSSAFYKLFLFAALIIPFCSNADTLNVPGDHATIQAAVTAATNGDTVLVAPGTYLENITIEGKQLILESAEGPSVTVIEGPPNGTPSSLTDAIIRINGNSTIVRGFTIQKGNSFPFASQGGGAITIRAGTPTIENNIIRETLDGVAIEVGNNASPIIRNNIIEDNTSNDVPFLIHLYSVTAPVIESNIFRNNTSQPINDVFASSSDIITIINNRFENNNFSGCGSIDADENTTYKIIQNVFSNNTANGATAGICIEESADAEIENNTFFNNQAGTTSTSALGADIYFSSNIGGVSNVTNNIFYNSSSLASIACNGPGSQTFLNNNIYNTTGPASAGVCSSIVGTNNNISQNPLFTDSSNSDFNLTSGSPSIDTGDNTATNIQATDIIGATRIIDGNNDVTATVDMGALEFNANGFLQFETPSIVAQENDTNASINICRIGGNSGAVGVNYLTANGTALDSVNYTLTSGTTTFTNGESGCKPVLIPLIDNNSIDPDVNFTISLSSPSGGALLTTQNQATIEINNDDNLLALNVSPNKSSYDFEETVTLTIQVTNSGVPSNATTAQNVTLTNVLPSDSPSPFGVTFSSVSASQGSCSGTQTIDCNLGNIAVGNTATVTITGTATKAGTFTNLAAVTADPVNTVPTNLTDLTTITVAGLPTAQELFPIVPLTKYNYRLNNSPSLTSSVFILPQTVNVNGVETYGFQFSEGSVEYFTNDSEGVKSYGEVDVDGYLQYIPPSKQINAQPILGETVNSNGTLRLSITGLGIFDLSYSRACTLNSIQSTSVPYGTFNAIRIVCTLTSSGVINGQTITFDGSQTNWFVKNVGLIKQTQTLTARVNGAINQTETRTLDLISIEPPPEISSPAANSTLTSGSATVNWNPNGATPQNWVVTAGTSNIAGPAAYNILLPENAGPSATSQTLSDLPVDGSSFYINLYMLIDGTWSIVDSISVNAFDAPSPAITSPTASTLTSGSVTVNWDPMGNVAQDWVATAGTGTSGAAAYNLVLPAYAGASATSQTLSGLPVDGSGFNINLFALIDGVWTVVDTVAVTAFTAPSPAITSPTGGSTLTSGSVTVNWNPNGTAPQNWVATAGTGTSGAAAYNLVLPAYAGASATSQTLSGLPVDGSGFNINLFALIDGVWTVVDTVAVTAFTAPSPAITSPTGGSTLTSGSVTVNWNPNGTAPQNWVVTAGTSNVAGTAAYNILLPSVVGTSATSQTLSGLPVDGSNFFINLYALENGVWSIVDSISVTAFTAPSPAITSPTGGSTLTSGSVTVNWNPNGNTPQNWVATAGTGTSGAAAYNLVLPAYAGASATSQTLSGLPVDGSGFNINLFALIDGVWTVVDTVAVTAFTAPSPAITSPTGGSTLTSGSVTVNWNPNGTAPQNWVVTAGTSNVAGTAAYNILLPSVVGTSATSQTLSGLPVDGSNFFINLYALENGVWSIVDSISVTAFTAPSPAITSPTGGSTLTSGSVTVNWNPNGTAPQNWVVTAGTSNVAGTAAYNILLPSVVGTSATSQTLSGLPVDGSNFFINLYALENGVWSIVDSISVTAFTAPSPAITSPTGGSTLTSGSVTVNWNPNGNTPDNWVVAAGTSNVAGPAAYNILLPAHAGPSASSQTLSGLPTDGSSFYLNLYALDNGVWTIVDSISVTSPSWISGLFNVSGSFSYSGCSNPSLNVTRSFTGTYNSNAQDGNAYSGYLSLATLNGFNLASLGLAVNSSFSGTHSQTSSSGSYTLDAYEQGGLQSRNQGNFSANLSGNSISVSGSGNDVFGETCSISYNFSGTRQ